MFPGHYACINVNYTLSLFIMHVVSLKMSGFYMSMSCNSLSPSVAKNIAAPYSPWARYRSPAPPPPMAFKEQYHFVQGNDTNQNRGVPIDLFGMHNAIWAILKMTAFENDENNKRSIYDCY